MKNTILTLTLMAAATFGCSGQFKSVYVTNPAKIDSSEEFIRDKDFKRDDGSSCGRFLYFGLEDGRLTSLVRTQHCVNPKENSGEFSGVRYIDTNKDGDFDKECTFGGYTDIGLVGEDENSCTNGHNINPSQLIRASLDWVLEPDYPFRL